ncbi:unnamed protein product [Cochlearia groenlandica]
MISDLPDQMLCEILSWLPTSQVVGTMLLSKRWKFLWKQVPKLDCDFNRYDGNDFREFVYRSLESLLETQVLIRSFKLTVSPYCDKEDVGNWIDIAVSLFVSVLEINLYAAQDPIITTLPKSLYTCTTLTSLTVRAFALDNIHEEYPICLSSLEYLNLYISDQISAEKFIGKVSTSAPLIKKTVVQRSFYDDPFLDSMKNYTSLNSFTLCSSKRDHTIGSYFSELENFTMCPCSYNWWDLLIFLLHCSPKLRYLKLVKGCDLKPVLFTRNQPVTTNTPFPECLTLKLQTLEWIGYTDTQFNKDVASFLLENATCLTTANIFPLSNAGRVEKLRIRNHLSKSPRGSTTCQLFFGD